MQIFQLSGERKKNNKKLFLFIDWLSGFVLYMFTSQYHSLKLTLRDLLLLWVQRESVLPEQQHFIMVSAGQTSVARWAGKYFFITVLSNEMDRVLVSWIFKFHFISFCGGFFFLATDWPQHPGVRGLDAEGLPPQPDTEDGQGYCKW